jgi:zinc protease
MSNPLQRRRAITRPLLAVSLLATSCLPVRTRPPEYGRESTYAFDTSQWRLSNGLRVTLIPDPQSQLVTMSLRFPVGAALEPTTARGVAHLAEHIAFLQPSSELNQTIAQMHAAHAVYSNASTSLDATQYISRFAPAELSAMVTTEALRWSPGQCLQVPEVDFIKERDIVINELLQRADEADVNEAITAAIWPAQHPYLRRIGGTPLQVGALTLNVVCAFIADNITAGNASLIFSGPVTESQIRSALAPWSKLASQAPNRTDVQKAFDTLDIQTQEKAPREVNASVETNTIMAAWPLPTDHVKLAQAQMIAHLLAVHVESVSDELDAEVSLRVVGGEHGRFAVIVIAAARLTKRFLI